MSFVQRHASQLVLGCGILGACAVAAFGDRSVVSGSIAVGILLASIPLAAYLQQQQMGPGAIRWAAVWIVCTGYLAACLLVLKWSPEDVMLMLPILGGGASSVVGRSSRCSWPKRRASQELTQE